MRKNYYQILGVGPDEDEEAIRSAYRRKAKLFHPDRAGIGGKALFQDVAEAYDVLSDPEKKRRYDRELKRERAESPLFRMRQDRPEPLIPKQAPEHKAAFSTHRRRKSPFQELFETVFSEYQAYGHVRGFEEDLVVRVVLSESEASRGCMLNFGLDIPEACPACGGTSPAYVFQCRTCGGTGSISEHVRLRIRIPSRAENGSVFEVPLTSYGLDRILRISIQVRNSE